MEVKIGVQHTHRELVLESAQTPTEIENAVSAALKNGGTLSLVDDKGRRIIVPSEKIAYVEIAEATTRMVGFTADS